MFNNMKKLYLAIYLLTVILTSISAQESLNISLYAQFNRGEERYSGSWCYTAEDGTEYALLGAFGGTAIYQIMEAGQIEEIAYIPGPETNWREITVVGDHAYVVTDVSGSDHSMQVIRLDQLPAQATLVTSYNETFTKGHIIQKDIFGNEPFVYIAGTTATEGVHIMDVSNPAQPVEAGLYQPEYYIHDCHVRGNIMFASAFYEGFLDIVDISDKSDPQLISQVEVPDGKVHSASMTMDGRYLFVAPEQDGLPARIFNIENLEDVFEVAKYTANPISLVHNPYILGDFAFISHNTEGLRVVDLVDPTTPVEVGFYDTWSGESGGFNGLWSACPYLPSGKIIGGNREDGLYVWEFEQTYAGRLYGTVVDSVTTLPIPNVLITISANNTEAYSDALGAFRTGSIPGAFEMTFSAEGYVTQTKIITFQEQSEETIVIKLSPTLTQNSGVSENNPILIFPNPFTENIFLRNSGNKKGQLVINTSNGQQITTLNLPTNVSKLDTANWPSGSYFLEWTEPEGNSIKTWKLIKQ
jgi:choice-of-anchor B domain-containing protein